MEVAPLLDAILAMLENLTTTELLGACGLNSELTEVKHTLKKMKLVVQGTESELASGYAVELRRRELIESLYAVEDMLDELVTMCQKSNRDLIDGNTTFPQKVLQFLNNKFVLGYAASLRVNKIQRRMNVTLKKLDEFWGPHGLSRPVREHLSKSAVTPSFKIEDFCVGRDSDKAHIVEMLCDNPENPNNNTSNSSSVVAIVGMGGLGKTTVAQLIFNDTKINQVFDFKIWATVSDVFDVRSVLCQFLESVTGTTPDANLCTAPDANLSELSREILKRICGKRYLLVLDDVWNESYEDWNHLKALLPREASRGMKWLVTTRSLVVAASIGDCLVYKLQGLSDADSLELFQKVAFSSHGKQSQQQQDPRLLDIAKSIVSKYAGHPLVLRTIATYLNEQDDVSRWFSCKNILFTNTNTNSNTSLLDDILPVLRLSYIHLEPPLKRCFSYCALFPKDYFMDMECLIRLWLAEGFIIPEHGRSLEDIAEEYISTLLRRCFFQDVKLDSYGGIRSFKMHDLMYDLLRSVARGVFLMASPCSSSFSEQTRHLSVVGVKDESFLRTCLPGLKNLRTFLDFSVPTEIQQPTKPISCMLLSNAMRLRALDACNLNISSLPNAVGNLVHLRYLNLSENSQLEVLPSGVTKLYNLQTLNLSGCLRLKKLPLEIAKLVNLRHLDLHRCNQLSYMPPGLSHLKALRTLTTFVVSHQSYNSVPDQLQVLKPLTNLRGSIVIKLLINSSFNALPTSDAAYLNCAIQLTDISIQWGSSEMLPHESRYGHEALLEGLKPHSNIRSLEVVRYPGATFPSWVGSSRKLVNICLDHSPSLHHLPQLSQLPQLKKLVLHKLEKLEYMESDYHVACDLRSRIAESPIFFPSLESLTLSHLPKLNGWWSVAGKGKGLEPYHHLKVEFKRVEPYHHLEGEFSDLALLSFPRLCQLKIMECPKLVSIPPCQQVEELNLYRFNGALQLKLIRNSEQQQQHSLRMRVTVDNVGYINQLPFEFHQYISHIVIYMSELEMLPTGKEVFSASMCSIQSLRVTLCSRLKSLSGLGWKHLTSLQRLELSNLPVLDLTPKPGDGERDVIPWHLLQNLQYVELDFLPKLVDLPEGIQHLTALQTLEVKSCHNLKALPEWIGYLGNLQSLRLEACTALICLPDSMMHLTSLVNLAVLRCSGCLQERCKQPSGEDWPKIMHIPHISVFSEETRGERKSNQEGERRTHTGSKTKEKCMISCNRT